MKRFSLILLLACTGCINITQYISLNENGNWFTSIRFEIFKVDESINKENLEQLSPSKDLLGVPIEIKDSETELSIIRELRISFPAKTPIPKATPFVLEEYKKGYRMTFKDIIPKDLVPSKEESDISSIMQAMLFTTAKYHLIISKKGLKTTLTKCYIETLDKKVLPLDLIAFQDIYLIDVPFLSFLETENLVFE